MKIGGLGLPSYRTFTVEELEEATNNFHSSTLMGEGAHGQVFASLLGCYFDQYKAKINSPHLLSFVS